MVQIQDWNDLDAVRNDLTADYTLENDLDSTTAGYDSIASDTANGGNGFNPIGDNSNTFTGIFNGNNYNIKDIYIDRESLSNGGIFSFVSGTLENIRVSNADITLDEGSILSYRTDNSTINNCNVSNSNIKVNTSGTGFIHTLIDSTVNKSYVNNTVIENISTNTDVNLSGFTDYVKSDVTECFVNVNIKSADGGGVCSGFSRYTYPDSQLSITDVYVTGETNLNSGFDISGFVDQLNINIDKSYTAINFNKTTDVNGFVRINDGNITDGYYDQEKTSTNSDGGTPLTTSEMQGSSAETNMSGFDFSSIWETVESSDSDAPTDGYPILQALDREIQVTTQDLVSPLVLSTLSAQNVQDTSIEFRAEVTEINTTGSADLFIQYRLQGSSDIDEIPIQSIDLDNTTAPYVFSTVVNNLSSSTTYEHRGAADLN